MQEKNIELKIFNSKTRKLEKFIPIDQKNIRMYVCGPTVYDRPHLGNVRSAVIYDVLAQFLRKLYGNLTYVRNITDIDDKIIAASIQQNIPINDTGQLGCLAPTYEPRATQYLPQIFTMIEQLLANGHAYIVDGHVLFDVTSYSDYGQLSNRSIDDMIAGSRIEVASYKKNDMDFVLWKPASRNDNFSAYNEQILGIHGADSSGILNAENKSRQSLETGIESATSSFLSPWGFGRPGWHIECSAMSSSILGHNFDIHGGGVDLIFPHHENEVAQSCCANSGSTFANYWVHNGFLTVDGQKMSKSLNNFYTVHEVVSNGVSGMALRYFYLTTHYRKPIDYSIKAIKVAENAVSKFAKTVAAMDYDSVVEWCADDASGVADMQDAMALLANDLNTASVLAYLHDLNGKILHHQLDENIKRHFISALKLIGLDPLKLLELVGHDDHNNIPEEIEALAKQRATARTNKEWQVSDELRSKILEFGFIVEDDIANGYTLRKK